jgi:hypothetical protein
MSGNLGYWNYCVCGAGSLRDPSQQPREEFFVRVTVVRGSVFDYWIEHVVTRIFTLDQGGFERMAVRLFARF